VTLRRFALSGIALLGGCGLLPPGETYPLPAAKLRDKLMTIDAPLLVLGSTAVNWRTVRNGDGSIAWLVLNPRGTELIRFVARTEPVSEHETRVDIAVEPPAGRNHDPVAARLDDNSEVRDLYEVAMAEQIDSALENRKFDFSRIAAHTMRATVATLPEISEQMSEAAEASQRQDAANMARAYREEGASGWAEDETAYGEAPEVEP
jgi:hypothetical protein